MIPHFYFSLSLFFRICYNFFVKRMDKNINISKNEKHILSKRWKNVLTGIGSFGIVCVLQIVLFSLFGQGIPCVFRLLTGLQCPGCGMTHAISSLLRGNIQLALHYNILSITLVPILALYLTYKLYQFLQKGNEDFSLWEIVFLMICLTGCIIFFIYRNFIV